ncbi:hypothetical protein J7K42_00405 [bacterium]|nr:hypothetical protein [bacterium]
MNNLRGHSNPKAFYQNVQLLEEEFRRLKQEIKKKEELKKAIEREIQEKEAIKKELAFKLFWLIYKP